jgi:GntR family transcriptional regulator, transcriptional repressor for pyruvate dehydrogenase complex
MSLYRTVQMSRVYEQIVEQIDESILNGTLKPGDQLPSERELAQQFGASRTAVREAVKSLLERGRLETYAGRGTFITDTTSHCIRESLDRMTKVGGTDHLSLLLVMLEPEIAALAAAQSGNQHIAAMRETISAMEQSFDDPEACIDADLDFHLALAEAVGNPVILALIDSLVDVLREKRMRLFQVRGGVERARLHHGKILDAVEERNPSKAREAMRAHLKQVREEGAGTEIPAELVV